MWTGDLLALRRPGKLPCSRSIGGEYPSNTAGLRLCATRRRPDSSTRRKIPTSARQSRLVLSRMVSKMGCKSCGELAMAHSTSEIAARCAASSVTCLCSSERERTRGGAALPPRRVFSLFMRRRSVVFDGDDNHYNGSLCAAGDLELAYDRFWD